MASEQPESPRFPAHDIGPAFTSTALKADADGGWTAKIAAPKEGWTAFFVELDYDSGGLFPLKVTTAVRVLPDTLPHKNIDLKMCLTKGNASR